ncbi:MAG: hypothetical protein ACLPYS_06025 [Vulcanimicrobiaceae bacterium]
MKFAWLIVAIFAARFLATAIAYPQVDGDLSWQRWLGSQILAEGAIPRALGPETFSAVGSPWIPQEWAFSIFASLAHGGLAWGLFAGAVALAAVAALALAAAQGERRGASPRALALCTTLAGIALFNSFGVRVQVVAWLPLVAYLALLEVDGPWCYGALAVAAIWSNLHASAMLAPVLATLAALGTALDERGWTPRVQRTALVALGSLGAICLNPFGWHLAAYAIGLFSSPFKALIGEWKVSDLDDLSFAFGALPLLLLGVLTGLRGERRYRDAFVLGAAAWLLLGAARNIAVFALVAVPIVSASLSRAFALFAPPPPESPTRSDRIAAFALPAISLALALVVAGVLVHEAPRDAGDELAGSAISALARTPGEHRVLCADFAWCGRVVGMPHDRVFLDGRADPYPQSVWDDFATIAFLQPAWRERLGARGVDAIIVNRNAALDQALGHEPRWHAAFSDKHYRLWLLLPRSAFRIELLPPRA